MTRRARRDIHVGPVRRERVASRDRVSATVDGTPVYFESADAEVAPSVEAFAGPFLLVALERRARLRLDEPPSATWRRNVGDLTALFRRWWGYDGPDPLEGVEARPDGTAPREAAAGQCFSAGIDSFYTLLCSPHPRDVLVAIHGFDIALGDDARMLARAASVRDVARATGRRAVVLRTSIRRHPAMRRLSWDRAHGSILAAAGHALSTSIGSLVIPASWGVAWDRGWGSHWDGDPLWSSDRLRVVHDDPTLQRWDKVPRIADEPFVFEHLHVCWENRVAARNCGRCEKCLRTRVSFARWGVLERAKAAFATDLPLVESLDRLPALTRFQLEELWVPYYLGMPLAPDVRAAVERLVVRTRRALDAGPATRLARRLRRSARRVRRLLNPRPR
ncbi:MAG TPA: hypothetical protein VND21_10855 [Planctomycetota bacterium]|nr:hypothetical protein [Planctomycetota bacterium]